VSQGARVWRTIIDSECVGVRSEDGVHKVNELSKRERFGKDVCKIVVGLNV
jgi:hypothetical protein